jgi:hypothetical protein
MSRDAYSLAVLGLLASMVVGTLVVTSAVWWFAYGEPTHQFPGGR